MRQNIVKGVTLLGFSTFIFVVSGYITNIWLGRNFGPELYGSYGIVVSVWSFVNTILVSGIPTALSKHLSASEKEENKILVSSLKLQVVLSITFALMFYFSAPLLAQIFKDRGLTLYFRISSFIIPFYSLFSLYTYYFNGLRNFGKQALISVVYSVSKVILIINLARLYGIYGSIYGFVIAPIVALVFGFKIPKKVKSEFPHKKLLSFSLPIVGYTLLITLIQSVDLYAVKILTQNSKLAGLYSAAQNISLIPFFVLSAISLVIFPSISKSINEKSTQKTSRLISYSLRLALLILAPLAFIISATSRPLVELVFSNVYLAAAEPLSILIFAHALLTVFSIMANILNSSGNPEKSTAVASGSILISILFSYLLIPYLGLKGAALATALGAGVAVLTGGALIINKFKVLVPINSIAKIILVSLAIYFALSRVQTGGFLLILLYIVAAGVYFLALFFTGEITRDDYEVVTSMVPKKYLSLLPKWKTRI